MKIEKHFIENYKFNEKLNAIKDIDGFLSNDFTSGIYPINKLICKNKDFNQLKTLENYGIPAGLVLSDANKIVQEQWGGGKNKNDNSETESIPEVLSDKMHDMLFDLISVKKSYNVNSKTKKNKK
jgi:hypothetical protein